MNDLQIGAVIVSILLIVILFILLMAYFIIGLKNSTGTVKEDYVSGFSMFLILIVGFLVLICVVAYDRGEQIEKRWDAEFELMEMKKFYGLPPNKPFKLPVTNIGPL